MKPDRLRNLANELDAAALILEDVGGGSAELLAAVRALRGVNRNVILALAELEPKILDAGTDRRCILVSEDRGCYQIDPNAEPEIWDDVIAEADRVTWLDGLAGWAGWRRAYRVTAGKETRVYFVD